MRVVKAKPQISERRPLRRKMREKNIIPFVQTKSQYRGVYTEIIFQLHQVKKRFCTQNKTASTSISNS